MKKLTAKEKQALKEAGLAVGIGLGGAGAYGAIAGTLGPEIAPFALLVGYGFLAGSAFHAGIVAKELKGKKKLKKVI